MDTTDKAASFEAILYEKLAAMVLGFRGLWPDDVAGLVAGILDQLPELQRAAAERAIRRVDGLIKTAANFAGDQFPHNDVWCFAIQRKEHKVRERLFEIGRFALWPVTPQERRRNAREARQALELLKGREDIDPITVANLEAEAVHEPEYTGHGGKRRCGQHSVASSVIRMAVRIYLDEREDPTRPPGYTKDGPMVRFVREVCEALGLPRPSSKMVRDRYREIAKEVVFGPGSTGTFAEAQKCRAEKLERTKKAWEAIYAPSLESMRRPV
jgi:hypothetical protein